VSNPTNPYEVGFYDTQSSAVDIAIFGEYAYVADNEDGLRVVDISDPTDPDEVGFYDTSGLADSVAVSEGYAYVADGYNGLRVVDVNDPTNPEEVGFYITPGWAFGVAISGEYVYIADREGGLLILYFSPPQNQPPVALNDSGLGFITDEDTAFLTASVFLNDYDPDGDPLMVESFDDSGIIGVLIYNGEGTFAYYPEDQFDWLSNEAQALDVFTYVVSDGVLTDTATVTITINGVNDVPVVDAGTNLEADEGEEVSFSGGFSDPDWSGGTIHWDFGDGITATNTLTPTHSYGDNGTYTVTLAVTDTSGGSVSDWLTASVSNVAPTIYEMPDFTVVSGEQFTITGVFTDPGWLDSYEVVIFWTQDIIEYFYLDAGVTEFNANFTFPKVGEYSIMIYVIDDDHAAGVSAFMVTVIDEWLKMYLPSITR